MQPLHIYFNELCLKGEQDDAAQVFGLSECAILLDQFFSIRADGIVAFPGNSWNENCGGVPFRVQLNRHLCNSFGNGGFCFK
jgi:hypothetical protein